MIPYQRVATTLPKDGPYFAANEIGLTDLWKERPAADGRGVRVGVSDEGFDLLHPALQEAKDATGKTVPKVADLGTLTTPDEDSAWVRLGDPTETKHGSFDAAGRTWIAPEDGTYRFGIFGRELILGPQNNSRVKKLSISVGVLWDEKSGHVWVDTDGDYSFRNQRAIGDYGVTHDVDWFGTKEGLDDNRIPFGLKMNPAQNAIYIRIGGEHGAFIAGALAGNKLTGGAFDGAAPNAQLVDDSLTGITLIASIVKLFSRPDVNVINRSGGIGRGGYTGSQEGKEDFARHVLQRVITVYDKPIATFSAAVGTIHVNDYAGPEMLRRNRQLEPPYRDTINSFVWSLPDGLVNVVLAPSANLETDSRYMPQDVIGEDGKRRAYSGESFNPPAPYGYVIGANNSPTIPVVSGLLADLISEARQEHVRYNAVRLNNAVFTGTRLLEGFPVSQQGYGLVNAAQSWDQLSKMAKADDPANPELTSFTISRVVAGDTIEVQGFHADLFEPRERFEDEVWITRRGGYAGERRYTFSLRGNDGSYELLDREATLERDKAVRVRFQVNHASGWKIVFLELRDAAANVVMQDVPLSVSAPDLPDKIGIGIDRYESMIPPLRTEYRYIGSGTDIQATRYEVQIPYTHSEGYIPGLRYTQLEAPPGNPVDAEHHVGPMQTYESLIANNSGARVQMMWWENRGRPEYATQYDGPAPDVPIHATLVVTKFAIAMKQTQEGSLSVTNRLAEINGHVELYDAKLAASEMHGQGNHAMAEPEREVPAGLSEWRVRVTSPAKGVHTDAFLFDCTGKKGCDLVSQQEITGKGAYLVVDNPEAGAWKIVVRSREQVSGNCDYKLSEARLVRTQAGATEMDTKHTNAEKWTVALPSTTQYAAFRIAGTQGVQNEKDGLLIAMTPLSPSLP